MNGAAIGSTLFLNFRQDLFEDKSCISIAQAVKLEASVEPVQRCFSICRQYAPGVDKYPDSHGHFVLVDKIIKYSWRLPLYAILVHINTSGFGRIILCGHINLVFAPGTGKDL